MSDVLFGMGGAYFASKVVSFAISLASAVLVLVIGFFIIKKLEPVMMKVVSKLTSDLTVERFVVNLVAHLLKLCVILMAVTKIGVETASLVALIGAIGFAIGLAFQGALSNFAGGIIILTLRPFSVDDYVEMSGVEGVIHSISILNTTLYTLDNKVITIPNGTISNDSIVNYTKLDKRRVDLVISASYTESSTRVIETIKSVVDANELILNVPEREVFLSGLESSSVDYTIRAWVNTADYWSVYWSLLENVKLKFDAEGIEIPYNKLDVNIIK